MLNKGFILVLTLWLLAILTIAASFFALWTERMIEQTRIAQQDIQGEIDMSSTQATVLYLFATQRYTFAGLLVPTALNPQPMSFLSDDDFAKLLEDPNYKGGSGQQFTYTPAGGEIHLDDRVYQGQGMARFAVQDEGGLINLNSASEAMLSRLMGLLGIAAEWRSPLIAKLQDYTDFDDLHHINGAETYEYQQENLPPPTNRPLTTPWEVQNVMDWKKYPSLWKDGIWAQLTCVNYYGLPRANTAPNLVLQAAYGFNQEAAQRIVAAREIQPIYSEMDLERVSGMAIAVDPMDMVYFPSDQLRLTLWYNNATRIRQIHLQLTPYADEKKPWEIDHRLDLPFLAGYAGIPVDTKTPVFGTALPAKSP
jgi:general secretion pathway protein K